MVHGFRMWLERFRTAQKIRRWQPLGHYNSGTN
jgi:hypothetical protein